MRRPDPRFAVLAAALALAGCAGYRLGSMLPPSLRTVHVPTVVNTTAEPMIEGEATRALLARIRSDGSLRIAAADRADAVLRVTLRDLRSEPIAFERGQTARANEYRFVLTASFEFIDARTGDVVSSARDASGETTADAPGDRASATREALPVLTEDLARDIVRRVVEAW